MAKSFFNLLFQIPDTVDKTKKNRPGPEITPQIVKEHGLTVEEFRRILDLIERTPNLTELGIFSVMWSEHCSYKSSRPYLRKLPVEGPRVLQGPGENAGVIDIGDGQAVAFKIESHNHPSFIEPRQGAATGVGGIMRDIFTMGARPIALMNSLRFGELSEPRTRFLLNGVVDGISSYGNCTGVPTVGGEIYFDACYNGNILVNAFCLGLVNSDRIFLAGAGGVGNQILYVGSKTGRDGIHGASLLASSEFDETTEDKRPTVQVGDPFTEKLLIEACLELFKFDWVVGVQDMGAAGLTSSSFEMAHRAETGVFMDLSKVPLREEGMIPYEILLSESQERMLFVIEPGHESEALAVLGKWGLDAAIIGEVIEEPCVRIQFEGKEVVNLPVFPVVDGALDLKRESRRPKYLDKVEHVNLTELPDISEGNTALKKLLACPNIASKEWVFEQYDHMVRLNTLVMPGSDAAVIRIKGTQKAIAMSVDCNSRYCYLDPYEGAAIAVAEACRNVVCSGAQPIGLTNCLNFGNPEKPEIMWQFQQAVEGMGDACRFFDIPVVSGNVSLYNETKRDAIYPTPTVAVVGLIEDHKKIMTQGFKKSGDQIALIGFTMEELGGTEYLKVMFDRSEGKTPVLDRKHEKQVQDFCRELIQKGLISSAHDCSEGGLAIAAAESCFSYGGETFGATLTLESTLRNDTLLFGETQSRIVVSFPEERINEIEDLAMAFPVDFSLIGKVGGTHYTINVNGKEIVKQEINILKELWKTSLGNYAGQVT
ncbi:MAG: phosphoribosylformylglycinamidine synthase subunit PurL [Nitrospina sp.]|jgi:phosphoribosylformylglycinamidine synthase subunit PurL|nr:phosphoribosylformylglycinamidine synthase subunit PurL [Nitrospina sp.]MBT3876116.1 phosphoribosylformylglycinamidine synthase subunit PurL [Nitrospina sp.]MBT4048873.1 phosphoribosylformylglycinamidine synthase subunit PurL [Nitrospina sp.]MBT4557582.1 phosphoribosylformylglycinamidine synthase subunit PurL [Nitrospina sp.]MBT5349486.1 phosphoribosylformylglycinamidine synthase subunit PurL [Nitrospina sp.]